VLVDAEKLNDYQTLETSRKIKEKIKKEIIIHGEVTIYTVRERRFIQKLYPHDETRPVNLTKNKIYGK
jgi:hypothetical protein